MTFYVILKAVLDSPSLTFLIPAEQYITIGGYTWTRLETATPCLCEKKGVLDTSVANLWLLHLQSHLG